MTLLINFLIGLCIVLGIIGVIVPLLPGVLLIWLGTLIYVLANGVESIGTGSFLIMSFIALIAGTSDIWLTMLSSQREGASIISLFWGLVGGFFGSFLLPVIGTIAGYIGGLLLSEHRIHNGDWEKVKQVLRGSLVGWGMALVVQLIGGGIILAMFTWRIW